MHQITKFEHAFNFQLPYSSKARHLTLYPSEKVNTYLNWPIITSTWYSTKGTI